MDQLKAYLKFLLKSTNQHGVHSPFVFNLLTQCLYKKDKNAAFGKIKSFRKDLLKDEREIEITDFGAGSRVFKSGTRKIGRIAKNAGISEKRAILLNKLCSYLKVNSAIELGTSLGISSAAMTSGNNLKLITIEGCRETAKIAKEYFGKYKLENIELKIGDFNKILDEIINKPEVLSSGVDLIYFDGNHQKEATLSYFQKLLPLAHNDSVFVFDDIHWSRGMEEAWEEIKRDPKVRVSIETFYWGLVFFRKEQEKEHFIVRL